MSVAICVNDRRQMVEAIQEALVTAAQHRREHPDDWIERERLAVTVVANQRARAHGLPTITVDDVERVESRAVGHIDYASKLALYVAELIWNPIRPPSRGATPRPEER